MVTTPPERIVQPDGVFTTTGQAGERASRCASAMRWPGRCAPAMRWPGRAARLAAAALLLGACGDAPEEGTAARVEDWTLTSEQLAELIVLAQPYPVRADAARELARQWVGVAALATRASEAADLVGEEAVTESMWHERREALLELDREDRLGAGAAVATAAAFANGTYRLFAHTVRRIDPTSSAQARELQRRTAERILTELVAGGSWEAAVAESEDVETRPSSGLLGLFARGELPRELDRVAWGLEPGQVSSVVESPQGFHVLYRPLFEDVSGLYASRLRERRLAEADVASAEGLLEGRGFRPASSADARVRTIAEQPLALLRSMAPVATWDGGTLTEATVARYALALPPGARDELAAAAPAAVSELVEELSLRELRLSDARARGLTLQPEVLEQQARTHAEEVRWWLAALDAGSGDARAAVDRYMRELVARRVESRSLPPLFEAWLLQALDWSVSEAGVRDATERARAMLRSAE